MLPITIDSYYVFGLLIIVIIVYMISSVYQFVYVITQVCVQFGNNCRIMYILCRLSSLP